MKPSQPYQPLLFRILHGLTGLFSIAAVLTAYWTYNTYDARWGRIPLPRFEAIEGIHGTFGLYALLLFPVFAVYAVRRGAKRLVQPDSLEKLTEVGQPIWWYTLHRATNTLMILALTFAVFSGKMMDETWLPQGELDHAWYYAHLIGWVGVVVSLLLHWLMSAKVGGVPLFTSVVSWRFKPQDSPRNWTNHLRQWWQEFRTNTIASLLKSYPQSFLLRSLEALVLISIIAAWIIPLFK